MASLPTIRYVIADDHLIFREGLKMVLGNHPDLEMAGEATNGKELLEMMRRTKPDVVLLDLAMPVMNGLETTQILARKHPDVRILILSMSGERSFVMHLIQAGAHGYLLKNTEAKEIADAIRCCVEGDYYFNNQMDKEMVKSVKEKIKTDPSARKKVVLNPMEKLVLQLICKGLTAPEIAEATSGSPRTIEGIRERLMEKTGSQNFAGLVMYAVKAGITFYKE